MNLEASIFPAKIFLFGEYSILNGSDALVLPLNLYRAVASNDNFLGEKLDGFIEYIKIQDWFENYFDISKILEQRDHSWAVSSDIPIGKGLGSSGAFVALFFQTFNQKDNICDKELISVLGKLESYFHFHSSGIDPFVSLKKKTCLFSSRGKSVELLAPERFDLNKLNCHMYLLDSKISRETSAYIQIFKEKMKTKEFSSNLNEYCSLVNFVILQLLDSNSFSFELIDKIGIFQRKLFNEMFPQKVLDFVDSLEEKVALKLCGAGGGGYFQLFSTSVLKHENLIEIT